MIIGSFATQNRGPMIAHESLPIRYHGTAEDLAPGSCVFFQGLFFIISKRCFELNLSSKKFSSASCDIVG